MIQICGPVLGQGFYVQAEKNLIMVDIRVKSANWFFVQASKESQSKPNNNRSQSFRVRMFSK